MLGQSQLRAIAVYPRLLLPRVTGVTSVELRGDVGAPGDP